MISLYVIVNSVDGSFYVGTSKDVHKRFKMHLRSARDFTRYGCGNAKDKWLASMLHAGIEPLLITVRSYDSKISALNAEARLIAKSKENGKNIINTWYR